MVSHSFMPPWHHPMRKYERGPGANVLRILFIIRTVSDSSPGIVPIGAA